MGKVEWVGTAIIVVIFFVIIGFFNKNAVEKCEAANGQVIKSPGLKIHCIMPVKGSK